MAASKAPTEPGNDPVVSQFEFDPIDTPFAEHSGFRLWLDWTQEPAVDSITNLIPKIRAFRPFLPAKEFETSLRFYKTIGFHEYRLGDTLAELSLGTHAFLLQGYYVKEWAENMVMHVLVDDVNAWWQHINSLDLANKFRVAAPAPPKVEPWGLTVAYVFDPSGVLWHFAEPTKPEGDRQ